MNNQVQEETTLEKEVVDNEVETGVEKHTFFKPNPDILRYRTNKFSFLMVMLAIVLNCLAFLDYFGKRNVIPDIYLGIDVVINILMMLALFVTGEEVKAYRKSFAIVSFVLAAIQIARIFFIPVKHFDALIAYGSFYYLVVLYVLSAVLLVIAGLVCYFRSTVLYNYLDSLNNSDEEKR